MLCFFRGKKNKSVRQCSRPETSQAGEIVEIILKRKKKKAGGKGEAWCSSERFCQLHSEQWSRRGSRGKGQWVLAHLFALEQVTRRRGPRQQPGAEQEAAGAAGAPHLGCDMPAGSLGSQRLQGLASRLMIDWGSKGFALPPCHPQLCLRARCDTFREKHGMASCPQAQKGACDKHCCWRWIGLVDRGSASSETGWDVWKN